MADSEETIKKLEAKIEEREHRIGIQEDVTEIMNLMSKYEHWHVATKIHETWKLYAMKTPDVSAEIADWGVWVGPESVKKLYDIRHRMVNPDGSLMRGGMFEHHLTTYAIQVAKDRKTAKTIFWSPGHESWVSGDKKEATWCWGRYGIDFIKEDGEWKIWHLKWYTGFRQDFYTSWQEPTTVPYGEEDMEETGLGKEKFAESAPDKPTTYDNPYTVDCVLEVMPPYPEPYDTWDGKGEARGPVD